MGSRPPRQDGPATTPGLPLAKTRVGVQGYMCHVFSFARFWCRPVNKPLMRDGVRTCGRWHRAFSAVLLTDGVDAGSASDCTRTSSALRQSGRALGDEDPVVNIGSDKVC